MNHSTRLFRNALSNGAWTTAWWTASVVALCFWVAAIYPSLRDSKAMKEFLTDLPPAMLALFGIDPELILTGAGFLGAQLYSLIAPGAVIGLAITLGVRVSAREEKRKTIDVLLALPITRRSLILTRTLAVATLLAVFSSALLAVLLVCNQLFGLDVSLVGMLSANLGLWLLGTTFGSLTVALGAFTGSPRVCTSAAIACALIAWFVHGFAPILEWLAFAAPASPFAWVLDHKPLLGNISGELLYALAASVALTGAAVAMFKRRDLGTARAILPTYFARRQKSRQIPPRQTFLLRGVLGKDLWERRRSLWVWTGALAALLLATFAAWTTMSSSAASMKNLIDSIPKEMLAMFGMTDPNALATPAGFLSSRAYFSVGPIAMVIFCVGGISRFFDSEEREGRLDLVLACGLSRASLIVAKLGALAVSVLVIALGLAIVGVIGDAIWETQLSISHIASANLGLALLGLFFAGLASALWAHLGCRRSAIRWTVMIAVLGYALNGLGALVDSMSAVRSASPFYWYLGDVAPLGKGLQWSYLALLVGALGGALFATWRFQKRGLGS